VRWNLKNKLGFFFVFIMLAAGVGMGVLYTISVTTQERLISGASQANEGIKVFGEDGIDNVLLIRELQTALLGQMLQWKNFLVRGQFQDMRLKYEQEMVKGDTRITAMLGAAQRAFVRRHQEHDGRRFQLFGQAQNPLVAGVDEAAELQFAAVDGRVSDPFVGLCRNVIGVAAGAADRGAEGAIRALEVVQRVAVSFILNAYDKFAVPIVNGERGKRRRDDLLPRPLLQILLVEIIGQMHVSVTFIGKHPAVLLPLQYYGQMIAVFEEKRSKYAVPIHPLGGKLEAVTNLLFKVLHNSVY